jgi:hypothetical protein
VGNFNMVMTQGQAMQNSVSKAKGIPTTKAVAGPAAMDDKTSKRLFEESDHLLKNDMDVATSKKMVDTVSYLQVPIMFIVVHKFKRIGFLLVIMIIQKWHPIC